MRDSFKEENHAEALGDFPACPLWQAGKATCMGCNRTSHSRNVPMGEQQSHLAGERHVTNTGRLGHRPGACRYCDSFLTKVGALRRDGGQDNKALPTMIHDATLIRLTGIRDNAGQGRSPSRVDSSVRKHLPSYLVNLVSGCRTPLLLFPCTFGGLGLIGRNGEIRNAI